jgi:hypothetical protein
MCEVRYLLMLGPNRTGRPGLLRRAWRWAEKVLGASHPAPEDEPADAVRDVPESTPELEYLRRIDAAYERLEQLGGDEARRLVRQLDAAWSGYLQRELDETMRQAGSLLVQRGQRQLWREVYDQYRRLDVDYVPGSELRWLTEGDRP